MWNNRLSKQETFQRQEPGLLCSWAGTFEGLIVPGSYKANLLFPFSFKRLKVSLFVHALVFMARKNLAGFLAAADIARSL
jgi:hypothetical protein